MVKSEDDEDAERAVRATQRLVARAPEMVLENAAAAAAAAAAVDAVAVLAVASMFLQSLSER